ncbi:MAG TPA: hypothetical protein VGJ04_09790 [Pirellulales bacterium]
MAQTKVYLVHLRRPRSARINPNEQRDDPFYELGSFGCTGCHSKNLFSAQYADDLEGSRLGFIQGGRMGSRLVFLSPPITVQKWSDRCEAKWTPAKMPFKYADAPILVRHGHASDFPKIELFARQTKRSTLEGGLSSRFRSRTEPLTEKLAAEVISVYETYRATAPRAAIASTYDEALPYSPPKIDRQRKSTYQRRIKELTGDTKSQHIKCKSGCNRFLKSKQKSKRCNQQ